MSFGKGLNYWLTMRRMTQTELARRTGVSAQIVSQYIKRSNTEPNILVVSAMANVLGVTIDELMNPEAPQQGYRRTYVTTAEGFSENLKYHIDRKGITFRVLGAMCGIPNGRIAKYMNGETAPRYSNAVILAENLGISVDELLAERHEAPAEINAPIVDRILKMITDNKNILTESDRRTIAITVLTP